MTKTTRIAKKQVIHPLSCWDIISFQFSSLPHRWDMHILQQKKIQYRWKVDFCSLLQDRYYAFVVIDTSFRICCKSRKFDLVISQSTFLQSLEEILKLEPEAQLYISNSKLLSDYNVEIYPLKTLENKRTHFFILTRRKYT